MNKQKRKGFTLVELLVVIAILAILATVSVVGYTAFITRAHESNAETEAAQIRDLLRASLLSGEDYYLTNDSATTKVYINASEGNKLVGTANIAGGTNGNANSDLDELLVEGKLIVATAEQTTLTYHYKSGNYNYDVQINLTSLDEALNAEKCEITHAAATEEDTQTAAISGTGVGTISAVSGQNNVYELSITIPSGDDSNVETIFAGSGTWSLKKATSSNDWSAASGASELFTDSAKTYKFSDSDTSYYIATYTENSTTSSYRITVSKASE